MADRFTLIVNTPDREFYRGDVTMLELTTSEGDIGIYAGHIPLTAVIVPGEYEIREGEPDYTGRIVVIGTEIHEDELLKTFGL